VPDGLYWLARWKRRARSAGHSPSVAREHSLRTLSQRPSHECPPAARARPSLALRQRGPVPGPLRPQRRRIRGPDAPRSWPHDLGRDGTPWVRTVRSGARRDVPARSVGSAVPERQVSTAVAPQRIGYRWTVCALLFVVTTINYVDRQVLGI